MPEENELRGKIPQESAITNFRYEILETDLNPMVELFGGRLGDLTDVLAARIVRAHAGVYGVTASQLVLFHGAAYAGDILSFSGVMNRAWNTSMEIEFKIFAKTPGARKRRHIGTAYLFFVAKDSARKSVKVPAVIPQTKKERARYELAEWRRRIMLEIARIAGGPSPRHEGGPPQRGEPRHEGGKSHKK